MQSSSEEQPAPAAEPQQEPKQASVQAPTAPQQIGSLYDASPTPSEAGGVSPVKARMASRFFTPPTATPLAAGCCSTVPGRSAASMQQLPSTRAPPAAQHHLQDSIYSSSSPAARRHVSAPALGKHQGGLLRHSQDLAGSHTSLVNVAHHEGAQVAVELFVPHSGEHVKDTFWPCTFNLSKVILGAGMMAIPKAFNLLGLITGSILMLLIACVTFFTLAGLISATAATGAGSSYGALVRRTIGPKAEAALQFAVLANCYIMEVVFVVVLGDILIGTAPEYGGLLPEWTGASPAHCFWLRRDVVLGAVSLLVLLPLAAMRSMERLAVVNIIGVASNGVFAGLMLALAAGALNNGVLQPPPLFPDWSELGSTPVAAAITIATVVPVLLNCDVCHQSLHPLMPLLQPYSVSRMQRLVAVALATCNSVYVIVVICSGLVFGADLEADVLANVNSAAMAPLIGPAAAQVMAALVRVGYLLSLIGSYVLLCYPLRQCLGDQFMPGGQATVQKHWLSITTLLVVSAGAIGCYLPSIWGALSLVGATTSTVQAFIIPGLVILSVERAAAKALAADRAAAGNSGSMAGWLAQGEEEQGLSAPLLAASQADGDDSGSRRRGSSSGQQSAPRLAAGAAGGASFKVDREPQPAWLCVMRQMVAVFAVIVGVGLFANSVLEALWQYAHPHAEGMAVVGIYRVLRGAR